MKNSILKIRNLIYRSNTVTYLDNVSMQVDRGETIVIFGPEDSGAQKLFDAVINIDVEFEGEILYKGRNIKKFDYLEQHNYKKEVGYLHGDYGLLSNMSAEQNISLPMEYHSKMSSSEVKKYINKLIYDLNLDHCKKLRPYDLTRSEILKTAFARALSLDPDLLYIEHAFENHCPLNIHTIFDILSKRSTDPDKSLIIITYNPEKFIDISDRYIMFFNGRIVFQGTKNDYLITDNPYVIQYRNNTVEGPMAIL